MNKLFALLILCSFTLATYTQCPSGQLETNIKVQTDQYGYELYWELLPGNGTCGNGTIFSAGNNGQVGCNGAGDQDATMGNGYASNSTITEGPWCLNEGSTYRIAAVDDWSDGGTNFTIEIEGFDTESFSTTGGNDNLNFTVTLPTQKDAALSSINTLGFVTLPDVNISAKVENLGQSVITDLELSYSIDFGTPVSQSFSGLSIPFGGDANITFPSPWQPGDTGTYVLDVRIVSVNGSADDDANNNLVSKTVQVTNGVPNLVDNYEIYVDSVTFLTVANSADGVSTPRDLDFHPDLSRAELWVINKGTANSGGSTVTIFDAGKVNQTTDARQDGNAWHFMSLPTAIAFGENTNFATSPGVQDANHQGGTFTGPTLWSSDMSIYAVIGNPPSQAYNGSHLDMLHGSPFSMGIAHERDNVYWIFDSYNEELVRYDFVDDHGPGQDYHGDALVRRYSEVTLTRASTHIPSHMVLDKNTGWLYIADNANARVLRVNTNTGNIKGPLPLINEPLTEHSEVENVTWEVFIDNGLTSPSGIEVIGDRLLVGDYSTGEISIYDISGASAQFVGDITTGADELMGIKVGPEGFIWFVDAGTDEVRKIETFVPDAPVDTTDTSGTVGIEPVVIDNQFQVYPQPAQNQIVVNMSITTNDFETVRIINMVGQAVLTETVIAKTMTLGVANLPAGVYVIELSGTAATSRKQIQIVR